MKNKIQSIKKTRFRLRLILLLVLVTLAGLFIFLYNYHSSPTVVKTTKKPKNLTSQGSVQTPKPSVNLQKVVSSWANKQSGQFSIIIYDPIAKDSLASWRTSATYFTASIYKVYVAYLALEDFESGVQNPDEAFLGSWTKHKCVREMIRLSHSPCAEKMLDTISRPEVNRRIAAYGIKDTSFPAFVTSARDVLTILERLYYKDDLTQVDTDFMRKAMSDQIYKEGTPTGMPKADVDIKVGFYDQGWHDTGFITLPDDREFIYIVLSKDAYSNEIADLAKTIYIALTK